MKTKTILYSVSIKSSILKKKKQCTTYSEQFQEKIQRKNDRCEMVCQFLKDIKK